MWAPVLLFDFGSELMIEIHSCQLNYMVPAVQRDIHFQLKFMKFKYLEYMIDKWKIA